MITGSTVLPLPSFVPFYFRVRAHPTISEPGTDWWSCWFQKRQSRFEFSSKTFISEDLKMFLDILQNLNAPLRDILQDLYRSITGREIVFCCPQYCSFWMTCIEFISCHKFTTTSTFCTIEAKRFFSLEFNIWSLCLGRPEVKNRKKNRKTMYM